MRCAAICPALVFLNLFFAYVGYSHCQTLHIVNILAPFTSAGFAVISLFTYLGELFFLVKESFYALFFGKRRWMQVRRQLAEIGFRSQPVVIVTGCFTGSVLTAQSLYQMTQLQMESLVGGLVAVSMLRELGPVITGLMLSGRVGAAIAAEIGTMKVTEQVDALRSMDIHPIDYLVTPRFIAILIAMPLLIAEAAFFGILLCLFFATQIFDVNVGHFISQLEKHTTIEDIYIAMIKGISFGVLIVLISCHQGLKASNGAVGVGLGTTRAMVFSSLSVIIANFFITLILNQFWPLGFAK